MASSPGPLAGGRGEDTHGAAVSHSAAAIRSFLIGKILLIPKLKKLKAAGIFQPEDHASKLSHRVTTTTRLRSTLPATALNYAGIYGSGVLLFEGHAWALRKLEEERELDEDTAHVERSAIAGSFGGLLYALSATPLVSLLRMPPYSHQSALTWIKLACFKPLQYTLPRDCGGFALYFGSYTYFRTQLKQDGRPFILRSTQRQDFYGNNGSTFGGFQALDNIGVALLAGSAAGIMSYLWRSPWDTLYKIKMGWRSPDAPLLSSARFLSSPRGLQAIVISGTTWAVYESAILAVLFLEKSGYLTSD